MSSLALLAASVLHAGNAFAVPIRHAADQFELDLEPAGATTSSTPGAEVIFVDRGREGSYVLHTRSRAKATIPFWEQSTLQRTRALHPGADVGPKFAQNLGRTRIGMAEVLRIELVVSKPLAPSETVEVVSYLIMGRSADHEIELEAPPSVAVRGMVEIDEAMRKSLSVELPPMAIFWVAATRYWHLAVGAGALLSAALAYFVYRGVRRVRPPGAIRQ